MDEEEARSDRRRQARNLRRRRRGRRDAVMGGGRQKSVKAAVVGLEGIKSRKSLRVECSRPRLPSSASGIRRLIAAHTKEESRGVCPPFASVSANLHVSTPTCMEFPVVHYHPPIFAWLSRARRSTGGSFQLQVTCEACSTSGDLQDLALKIHNSHFHAALSPHFQGQPNLFQRSALLLSDRIFCPPSGCCCCVCTLSEVLDHVVFTGKW